MITRRAKGVEPVAALLYKHVMNIFNETDAVTMEICIQLPEHPVAFQWST